ncbi:MAG: ComEC/Rec2 family competence protein, partial [Alphaproteobacteria bacterium]|nr:ComEC/Rec2 family competence protein [Alphaproteobacteria bacterium]
IINTPQITQDLKKLSINATVLDIDYDSDKLHLLLQTPFKLLNTEIENEQTANVKVSLKNITDSIDIGDTIQANVSLFPAYGKQVPDGFDYARWSYFNNLTATGFITDYSITEKTKIKTPIRNYIHNKVNFVLTDALLLGYKHVLQKQETEIWKTVGIAHVWSISGFHMTLVGGWLFVLFYFLFRLCEPLTKRIPARYPAMLCSWLGLLGYLYISGLGVASIRAFLMVSLVFLAFVCNRSILSMRSACIAFLVIFCINPFYVMNAGFQLSFAAIFGLLWFFSKKTEYVKRNIWQKIFFYFKTILLTTCIATLFTLPFTICNFGYIPLYTLIGNIILIPIFSLLIMPLLLIGTLCAVCGYGGIIDIVQYIYDITLQIAQFIANLPNANIIMPKISNVAMIFIIIGFLSLIFIQPINIKYVNKHNVFYKYANKFLFLFFVFVGLLVVIFAKRPIFYVSSDHELAAFVNNDDKKLLFNKGRSAKHFHVFNTWKKFNFEPLNTKNIRYKCDKGLCLYNTKNWKLAYMQKYTTTAEHIVDLCKNKRMKYIVTYFDIYAPYCNAQILDKRFGSFIIYPSGKIIQIINQRLWHHK